MSYQLIYTSAPHLIESGRTGYGTVARSKIIPIRLAQKLCQLSIYKENTGIEGPQYSYRIVDCAGATYHVLTCVHEAGADYTGRDCHIAHHLALTHEEMLAMRCSHSRPTPAGVMLALEGSDFWYRRWEGAPLLLESEPRLTASMMPDASRQATWKTLTSHKSNARAFFTAPYEHDCLVMLPEGMPTHDVLLLLHESDWLAPHSGWGQTFTTNGTTKDTVAATQRIAAIETSPINVRARRTGRPPRSLCPNIQLTNARV